MGFVKVPDDLRKWAWMDDKNTFYVYMQLLLDAAWGETKRRGVTLKRGQIAISQREFAEKCGVTRQNLRTILERLKSTNKITIAATQKISIITIVDYDCEAQQETHDTTKNQPTDNPVTTHCQPSINPPSLLNTNIQNNRAADTRACARESGGFDKVKEAFNSLCPSLPRLEYDLSIQQTHLIEQARLRLGGVSFEEFFKRVERSDFLCGRTSSGFKADFNWILRPENLNKILAGNYDHNLKPAPRANERSAHKSWEDYTDEEIAREAEKLYE